MADSIPSPQNTGMQQPTSSVTIVETEADQNQEVATLRLRLKKAATDKKVQWSTETVDNEHMNKKKSSCCCIYTKPRSIEEDNSSSSSSDSDDECQLCKGHIRKKKTGHPHNHDNLENEQQHNHETTTISENDSGPSCLVDIAPSSGN